ncbi:MAG TPA: DUF6351 family protein [Sporichthyaceae bacterium]|jgi:hypothetical protein
MAVAGLAAGTLLFTSVVNAQADKNSGPGLGIQVLSNRADLISGGEAYVEITEPAGIRATNVHVLLDGHDISREFARRDNGRILGLVQGMSNGPHVLTAHARRLPGAALSVVNHSVGGPVFAGPQLQPWICTTKQLGLGESTDAACNAPTHYDWYYMPADPKFVEVQPYDPAHPATDVRMTTNDRGVQVPYIVRDERGTSDRGVYDIAVLYDPTKPWTPWDPQPGWNGKVLLRFGASCNPGHVQGDFHDAALQEFSLSRGFAVLTSGMTVMGLNCNDVVAAEAAGMLKEHFIDHYGQIRYTIGDGCSGGSTLLYTTADNYPGLLDGLRPQCSYADFWGYMQSAQDCSLLGRVFYVHPNEWGDRDRAAVAGFRTPSSCHDWAALWQSLFEPANQPGCLTLRMPGPHPASVNWVYNPARNPSGVRCSLQDYQVNEFGLRADGKANRPYDNVGVQYGLAALRSGAISPEQFLDLNQSIGGWDIDDHWQAARSVADPDAISRAYRGGRIVSGTNLARVPIVNIRYYDELGYHTAAEDDVLRARLRRDTGSDANMMTITAPNGDNQSSLAFVLIDQWLSAIEADHSTASVAEKVRADRPAAAQSMCVLKNVGHTDAAQCLAAYPTFSKPRLVAGGPATDDMLKCQLRPISRADYPPSMTVAQFSRLMQIFPDGVCDYSVPGVDQTPTLGPWQSYASGPDSVPLGPAPVAIRLRR